MLWQQFKQKSGRRVVITGMGTLTPLGNTLQANFDALLAGKTGITKIPKERFPEIDEMPVKIGGLLNEDLEKWYKIMPSNRTSQNAFGFIGAYKAMEDSGYKPKSPEEYERFGVIMGTGTSTGRNIFGIYDRFFRANNSFDVVHGGYMEETDIHGITNAVSRYFKTKGPVGTITAACATGQAVIQEAYRNIVLNEADVMIAGSAENVVIPYGLRGFATLGAINVKDNDNPEGAARPMDDSRMGLVASDGGNGVICEELQHALKRGARIYGEVLGYSMNCDGYHLTRPTASGEGIFRTMKNSIEMAGLQPKDLTIVHAHAAGTREGDIAEMIAIDRLFGENRPYVTGCKGNTGHMMCTIGTYHCIESLLSVYYGKIPAIRNLKNPIQVNGKLLNYVREPVECDVNYVVMNNVGFGGINSSLVVGKYKDN
ncbi:hypothetical protein SteCoe_13749 [Stentor coeruleus]|uniref:beta-ketoacyl-[acyl-carrier-protein] synthase I n=1 Tax=Stentor coeruleus TaxID=5963 RepID=A0A1R2C7P3_9CILI|nr:hypothetical protein SteCoe_13749 [Stentor coeruleus]